MLWKEWLKRDVSNFRKKKRQENMAQAVAVRRIGEARTHLLTVTKLSQFFGWM
jgi:hypothetical protein